MGVNFFRQLFIRNGIRAPPSISVALEPSLQTCFLLESHLFCIGILRTNFLGKLKYYVRNKNG